MYKLNRLIYPQINNNIEYGVFENIIESYYLESQIRDDFTCTKACYAHNNDNNILETRPQCTHTYDHISQQLISLANTEQQHQVYTSKVDASLFTSDTSTQCAFNIVPNIAETETEKSMEELPENNTGIHFHSKHKYRDTFGNAHIQHHDFHNGDAFTYKDKYTALLQQELHNPYWCLHDPVTIKVTIYQRKKTLTQCHMQWTFQVTPKQSLKLIMCHTKQYLMMIKACFQQS